MFSSKRAFNARSSSSRRSGDSSFLDFAAFIEVFFSSCVLSRFGNGVYEISRRALYLARAAMSCSRIRQNSEPDHDSTRSLTTSATRKCLTQTHAEYSPRFVWEKPGANALRLKRESTCLQAAGLPAPCEPKQFSCVFLDLQVQRCKIPIPRSAHRRMSVRRCRFGRRADCRGSSGRCRDR